MAADVGGVQPAATGEVRAVKNKVVRQAERKHKVKFLLDTVHPDYGAVKAGEVYVVTGDYLDDYEELGIAELTEDAVTERPEA